MNLPDISAHWLALHEGSGRADRRRSARRTDAGGVERPEGRCGCARFRAVGGLGGAAGRAHPLVRGSRAPLARFQHAGHGTAFLMAEHGLRQSELPEISSQGVVSEVLSGKRALNLRQVKGACQADLMAPGGMAPRIQMDYLPRSFCSKTAGMREQARARSGKLGHLLLPGGT